MSALIPQNKEGVNRLLDCLISCGSLKNDAALAVVLNVAPPVISKIRNGHLSLGARLLISMHEAFNISIKDLKSLAAGGIGAERK